MKPTEDHPDLPARPVGTPGSLAGVTGLPSAQEQLPASREWRAELADTVPDGITRVDRDGRIVFANAAAERILRLSRRDIAQRTYDDPSWRITALDGGPFPKDELPFARVMRTGEPVFNIEHAIEETDGTRVLLSVNAAPVRDAAGALDGMVASITDITERKRTETALRENEERLRLALAGSNQGLFDLDLQTGEATITPEYATMLGYDPATFHANLARWNELIHPADRDAAFATLQACVTGATCDYTMEYRLRAADGSWRWILSAGRVAGHDPAGRPVRLLGVHTDITERKRAEEAVQESHRHYEDLVANIPLGIYRVAIAPGGRFAFVYVSDRYCEIVGLSRDEILADAEATTRIIHPDDRGEFDRLNRAARDEQRAFIWEGRIVVAEQPRWLHVESVPSPSPDGATVWTGVVADITRRKRMEAALRESEGRVQAIFRAAPTGIGVVANRILQEVNERILDMTGYAREELVGGSSRVLYPSDEEFDYVGREKYRQIAEKGTGTVETRWRRKDGAVIDVLLSSTPLDPTDLAKGVTFTALDITDRKRTEEELRRTSQWLLRTQRISRVGGFAINVRTGAVWASPEARRIYGYDSEAAISLALVQSFPLADFRPMLDRALRDLVEHGRPYDVEFQVKRSTDDALVDIHSVAEYDRAEGLMLGVIQDVTDRKRAEHALRESEQRHRTLFERMGEGVVHQDADGRIVSANPAACRLLGLTLDQMQGRTSLDPRWRSIHEDGTAFPGAEHPAMVALRTGEPQRGVVMGIGLPERSEYRWILIDAVPEFAPGETKPHRVFATFRDITERRRAEQDRLEMERRLLHSQKLESLGVLAGGIAHDFNNLLMAILGNLDLALMDLSPVSPARASIEQSVLAARRAADLTRQMLAYSGKGKFDIRELDLSELVEENAHLFRTGIAKIVTLKVQLGRGLPPIKADPGQMQQVIMNLITNASEAMGECAGVISLVTGVQDCDAATLARSRVDEIPPPGRFVFLEVTDTGCGMDDHTLQRLFDPFFTTKFMGRGLGMSAILGIVRAHHGAIIIDSEVGRGTTIRVLFPAGAAKSAAPPPAAAAGASDGARGTAARRGAILVVDDEEMVRNVCGRMLRQQGWSVLAAASGPEAITLFQTRSAEIVAVILDLSMPQMDGIAACRELRAIRPDLKVILSSGYSNDERSAPGLAAEGIAGFIQKPYTAQSLRDEIARVLRPEGQTRVEDKP
jgi:PAS domain S-box-containing protein